MLNMYHYASSSQNMSRWAIFIQKLLAQPKTAEFEIKKIKEITQNNENQAMVLSYCAKQLGNIFIKYNSQKKNEISYISLLSY